MGQVVKFYTKEEMDMSKRFTPEYVNDIRQNRYNTDNAVEKIFQECGIAGYPINVFEIARKLNFDIMYGKFRHESIYGAIWDGDEELEIGGKRSKRFILVNAEDSKERQLFTIAHELGHFVLHCTDQANFFERYHGGDSQPPKAKEIEDEADFFAASLLMPRKEFKSYIEKNRSLKKDALLSKICSDFWVEKEAAKKRFVELGIAL